MTRSFHILTIGVFALGLLSHPAHADSGASIVKEQTKQLQKYGGLEDLENRCKSKFKVSIDASTFSKVAGLAKNEDKAKNLYSHCSKPIRALTDWCANGYDKVVKKQVSSYVCRYDAGKPSMSIKKGVLTVTTDWEIEPNDWSKNSIGNVLMDGEFSVGQAALIRNDTGRIKDARADMKRRCKGEIKWSVDWKSFKSELSKRTGKNDLAAIWGYCNEPLAALEGLCVGGQAKLMKDQVSSFVCRFDKNKAATMTLENKVLTLVSNFEKNAGSEGAKNLVGDTLRDGDFSVRQAAFIRNEEKDIQRLYGERVDNSCKTKIAWSVDWKGFVGEIENRLSGKDRTLLYASCGVPLNRLADICGSDRKNKVKAKIKSYSCVYGGPKKQKLSLKKGKLQYNVDFTAEDSYGTFDKFLVKNKVVKKRPVPKKLSPKDLASIRRILGEGANTQSCYKACARRKSARAKQQCRNTCQ
jgi:hypothetical protein